MLFRNENTCDVLDVFFSSKRLLVVLVLHNIMLHFIRKMKIFRMINFKKCMRWRNFWYEGTVQSKFLTITQKYPLSGDKINNF